MVSEKERGVALVMTLFLMASLSALAVSLMFLSQTETSASRNYKTMSQARYAGEAGIHKAINFLVDPTTYPVLTATTGYVTTVSPVTYNGQPVVLSATTGVSSNYPDASIISAFNAAGQGSLAVGSGTVGYASYATLMSMRVVDVYASSPKVVQTWRITASGTVPGSMPATVEVMSMLERDTVPSETYAIFATGTGCGAINLGGTTHTDSYDSRNMSGNPPAMTNTGGGVGTNGNLEISGNVTINGNLDTPRTGVGDCNAGTPTALTAGGSANVTGSIVQLPQAKTYPTPDPPAAPYLPANTSQAVSASLASCTAITAMNPGATCLSGVNSITVTSSGSTPLVFNNLQIGSQVNMTLRYGVAGVPTTGTVNVNVNSLVLGAQAKLTIGQAPWNTATTTGTPPAYTSGPTKVVMNVQGTGQTTPVDFSGGSFGNASYDPANFQLLYGGTGQIELIGGGGAAIALYAPNASVRLNGGEDLYGSVLCKTYTNNGNGSVHYDTAMSMKLMTLGNYVMSSFSWKKY